MTPEEKNKIASILEAIEQHTESSEVKSRLIRCPGQLVNTWKDEYALDLAHHCILHNNIVAFVVLLSRGHFKSPYRPAVWPYLHMVACFGYRSFISTIAQELTYQNDKVQLDWEVYDCAIKPRMKNGLELEEAERTDLSTPIDVAALFGHIGCVRLLLDFWQVDKASGKGLRINKSGSSLYLSLACQAQSSKALRLLLTEHSDYKEALEISLRMSVPECVDVILRDGGTADVKKAFQGMNLFHVLYSYSSCLNFDRYSALVDMTTVLIRHQQDVNTLRPSRTFPLHSLLSCDKAGSDMEGLTPYLLATLLLLLKAGADPNVDEIIIEEKLHDLEENTAYGRLPYSSAINCVLSNLPIFKCMTPVGESKTDPGDSYAYKCIELLLKHGADLSHIGKFNALPYHDFCSSYDVYHYGTALHLLASTRAQCFTVDYPLLRLILNYGVDADYKGSWYMPHSENKLCYALNVLPFALWTRSVTAVEPQRDRYAFSVNDMKNFTCIMKFMSQSSLVLAYREFIEGTEVLRNAAKTAGKLDLIEATHLQGSSMFGKIISAFEAATREPWALQQCCSHTIWRSCRMHLGNVYDLPIPGPLRNVIVNFH